MLGRKKIIKIYFEDVVPNNLISEWDDKKNGKFIPREFTYASGKKEWWKCKKGHEWMAPIYRRTLGAGCPYCSGLYPVIGENDLLTLEPELSKEWNNQKNGNIVPQMFKRDSHKKVWWKCKKGHEWEAVIESRTKGRGCPFCSGRRAIAGENDIATLYPFLLEEWDWDRNIDVFPSTLLPQSNKRVWWRCKKCLQSWEAPVYNRMKGSRCPFCAGRRAIPGKTDLETLYPNLLEEWDYVDNIIKPSEVTSGSAKRIVWKCENCGNKWIAPICRRVAGAGCPYCSGRRIERGKNDLLSKYPSLCQEWDYEKNSLFPSDVGCKTSKKFWWKCKECGNSWQSTSYNRIRGNGCPYCSSAPKYAIEGKNDLETVFPEIAKEWCYEKNIGILPRKVTCHSPKKVWWKCNKGHTWKASISHRTEGTGCPFCYKESL